MAAGTQRGFRNPKRPVLLNDLFGASALWSGGLGLAVRGRLFRVFDVERGGAARGRDLDLD